MSDTRELAQAIGSFERALLEFGRAARASVDAKMIGLEAGGFIMCKEKKTVEELEREVKELERELEIAKLEKQVRELWANIERARAYPPCNPPWYHPCETGGTTTPFGQYTIYYHTSHA
jgi:hypothetical protein